MAVAANSPLGRVVYEPERDAKGEPVTWVERLALDKLDALRASSESYSDGRAGRVRLVLSQ